MSSKKIYRVTLFKIPEKADQHKLIEMYREMPHKALKVCASVFVLHCLGQYAYNGQGGKPYIIHVNAGEAIDDQRNQGYTLVATSVFASREDMEYYDNDCEAHAALKAVAKRSHNGAMMVFFESALE